MTGALTVRIDDVPLVDDGETVELAWIGDAREQAVRLVLDAPVETGDGRSRWCWIRMANGDLFLACAPQGATYERLEGEPGAGWGDAGGDPHYSGDPEASSTAGASDVVDWNESRPDIGNDRFGRALGFALRLAPDAERDSWSVVSQDDERGEYELKFPSGVVRATQEWARYLSETEPPVDERESA